MKFVGNLSCEVTKKCHEKSANMIINTPLHKHFIEDYKDKIFSYFASKKISLAKWKFADKKNAIS